METLLEFKFVGSLPLSSSPPSLLSHKDAQLVVLSSPEYSDPRLHIPDN